MCWGGTEAELAQKHQGKRSQTRNAESEGEAGGTRPQLTPQESERSRFCALK
jgi:hypothetical protein